MPIHGDTRTIILDDPDQLPEVFEALDASARAMDFTATFTDRVFPMIAEAERGYFASQTGPDGSPWPEWHFRPQWASDTHPTLHITGALEESLTGTGPGHVESASASEATYGTSLPYSGIHQEGGQIVIGINLIGRGGSGFRSAGSILNIPARPHVGLTEQALDRICDVMADAAIAQIQGF